MAELEEIRKLFDNGDLRNKVEAACVIAAEGITGEPAVTENHANRVVWMKAVFRNPRDMARPILMSLLAASKDLEVGTVDTPGTILGASGAQIQAKVDAAVDVFADGS